MLESILYFLLGFLAAALLGLMVSPMIWQRAVSLTKRRIERSVPLTLNEIQADKDQLRAEFAMSTRRLEISIDELREKAANQVIEINRKRDDVARLAEEQGDKLKTIEELQAKSGELRTQLRIREEQLDTATEDLGKVREKLEEKALQYDQLGTKYERSKTEADSKRIELVAKQTEFENLTDKLERIGNDSDEVKSQSKTSERNAKAELAKIKSNFSIEKKNNEKIQKQLDSTKHRLELANNRLERREQELSRARKSSSHDDATNSELTAQLVEQHAANVELEAKLAQNTLQMEALLSDASNNNVKKAMESLQEEKSGLTIQMDELLAERDELAAELKDFKEDRGDEWETERRENAILRERINDLAAQVTAMTAALEGDNSPINEILARSQNTKPSKSKKGEKSPPQKTLADRIRALQDAAG